MIRKIGLWAGPLVALIILLFCNLDPAKPEVTRTAAVAVLMAVWWITEAIPIPATALLPVALFPLLGILPGKQTAALYFNSIIFLFIGGFIMALAMQRWNLHKRIALHIILLVGVSPGRIMLGFMAATFFLSMWISNTATTMMMVPMAMAIIAKMQENFGSEKMGRFATGLLISLAYAASIGGMATLIGTPPNLAFSKIFNITFPGAPEITFAEWIIFALPLSLVFAFLTWLVLKWMFLPSKGKLTADRALIRDELRRLGKTSYEEKWILVLFSLMAFLWLFRKNIILGSITIPGWADIFPVPGFIDDGTIAIAIAVLLFIIPSHRGHKGERERLINWETAQKLHWGIVILFGGGFALAAGFSESGLAHYLGSHLVALHSLPPLLVIVAICTLLTFLTELTSNTATTQIFLPILASMAIAIGVNPLLLMIPATLSASCAFMLPVATPPNAIVFGSGEIQMRDMMRSGIILNILGIILITAFMYLVGTNVLGIDLNIMPDWAV